MNVKWRFQIAMLNYTVCCTKRGCINDQNCQNKETLAFHRNQRKKKSLDYLYRGDLELTIWLWNIWQRIRWLYLINFRATASSGTWLRSTTTLPFLTYFNVVSSRLYSFYNLCKSVRSCLIRLRQFNQNSCISKKILWLSSFIMKSTHETAFISYSTGITLERCITNPFSRFQIPISNGNLPQHDRPKKIPRRPELSAASGCLLEWDIPLQSAIRLNFKKLQTVRSYNTR